MKAPKYFDKKKLMTFAGYIFIIVQKNVKLLMRSRASTLIAILGPLLLIFFAGVAFDNTNLYSVKIGAYSSAYNSLSNSFISKLQEKQFKILQYPAESKCIDAIKSGDVNACIVFAPDFKPAQNMSNEITFYLDYSKLNLVWTVMSIMNEQISSRSKELSANLTSEIIKSLDVTKRQIQKRRQSLVSLTSQNDDASKRVYDIASMLQELDLQADTGQMGASNLSIQKSRVKHWIDNSVSLGESALQDSLRYVNAVDDMVKASTASADLKNSIHDYLKKTVSDIETLNERLKTTKNIMGEQSSEFDSSIDSVLNSISLTKNKIDGASNARNAAIDDLNAVKTLLDKALINILELQKSLNEIDANIGALQVTDPGSIVQPIVTNIKPVIAERSYLNYLFPVLLALVIMYTAILLTPILILLERNSPSYFRNFMTPVKDFVFITATFSTSVFILLSQLLIILIVSALLFSSQFLSSLFITLFVCLLTIAFFTFIGMIVGYVFNSEESAILSSTMIATFLLFLSDVFVPIETMSPWLGALARINPFVVASSLLRKTIVLNATIGVFWEDLLLLLFYCILAGTIAVVTFYNLRRHNIAKYLVSFAPTKQGVFSRINPKIARFISRK